MTGNGPNEGAAAGTAADELVVRGGLSVLLVSAAGPPVRTDRDAVDLIAKGWEHEADLLVIPVQRLSADFFVLSTRVAGAIVQKFVDYRCRLVVLGDISAHLDGSSALRAFVHESNRGRDLWFLPDAEALDVRLATMTSSR